MNVHEYLELVADVKPSDIPDDDGLVYRSKFDGSYITRVGMEDGVKFLAKRGITEQLTHGVGFSPSEQKWYGWSHRAIYGFGIGSACVKGDCHYKPTSVDDLKASAVEFWHDTEYKSKTYIGNDGEDEQGKFFMVNWEYNNIVPNVALRNTIGSNKRYYDDASFGKGEWTALTLEDAKQMAIDFNQGVS